jgi:ABC-2 type transport system permease protein
VLSGQPARIDVIRSPTRLISGQLGESLARGFASRVEAVQLSVRTAAASGATADPAALAQEAAAAAPAGELLQTRSSGGRDLKPAAYFGPAMALFFLFFTVGTGARSLLAERSAGTLARLEAAPVRMSSVIIGKVLAMFVMGLTAMATLIVTTSVLLGAEWGNPLAVLALIASAVLAAMGIVILVMSLSRTEAQAGAYASAVAILLALVGGSFIPISFAPAVLQKLALLTPNGWALKAFTDLATGGSASTTVFTAVAVCLTFAAVTGAIGLARASRTLAR